MMLNADVRKGVVVKCGHLRTVGRGMKGVIFADILCGRPHWPCSGVFRNWTRGGTYKNHNGLRNVTPPAGRGVHQTEQMMHYPRFSDVPLFKKISQSLRKNSKLPFSNYFKKCMCLIRQNF